MLKLDSLLVLVTVAEAGSISEAARRMQISKSVASERLAELERTIGATLMQRSTRSLTLTEEGSAFVEHARRILQQVSDATGDLAERRGELAGPLRISAPVSFGILHLGPAINHFLRQYPRIELSLELDDRFVGATDGFDAVIRHGRLPDNRQIAKRLAPSRRILVASPSYLRKHGTPRTIADLSSHRGIIYSNRGASDWRFRQSNRWTVVRPDIFMRVNNGIIMRDTALEGLGLALLPTFFVHKLLASQKLRAVDVGAETEAATIFIAYPNDRRVSAKVLALIAHLRVAFGTPPYWDRTL